ncbi:MAG: glycosyltransferase [Candidatus Shapirobacteria bacterium]|jgi:glycosyltransferase involved in cell wall biosynthesis
MTPLVSIVIPTLNSQAVLSDCLKSIKKQIGVSLDIIIADGGSTDKTIYIANQYKCQIVKNPLKTAESGKAIGLKHASGEFVGLIDSDNILPKSNWLKSMISPLIRDKALIGSEPWKFTYRKNGGFIERYSSLIGANDPYAFVTGIYDRKNYINHKWTEMNVKTTNYPKYLKLKLTKNQPIPTIGANGTIFRSSFIKKHFSGDYLFDIDVISLAITKTNLPLYFAKVKIGIIHTFCESSISKFIKKQQRRLTDYYTLKEIRAFNWDQTNRFGIVKFTFYTCCIIWPIVDSFRGFFHKPDFAWFFHPFACVITLFIYTQITIKNKVGLLKPLDRQQWQQ